jgi:DNA polymerase-3 subunit epsilon
VYIFYGEKGMPLYIGKSKNIKNRVLSHFSADIHSPTEMRISQQIESIETVQTVGELGALFLESQMIKKMLPLYNKKSRIKRELIGIKSKINEQGYQEVYLQPITTILPHEAKTFLGFSRSRKQAKALLADLAKQYGLCEKLLGLEKTAKACFAYRLKRCGGACVDEEKPLLYNMKCSNAFAATKILTWPFSNPILIEEQEFANSKEYFLVDQWCYLGSIRVDNEGIKKSSLVDTSVFDLDVYQILKQYLKDSQNYKKVRLLQPNQISSFFDNQPIED